MILLRKFSKQLLLSASIMVMIYIFMDVTLYRLYPMQDPVNTSTTLTSTIHYSWSNHVVLGRKPFSRNSKKIVFLGTSNVLWGFLPEEFESFVNGYEVINMSAGDMNYAILRRYLDLIYEATPQKYRNNMTFIIGVSFPQFVENKALSTPTRMERLEREMLRYGLYKYQNGTLVKNVPDSVIQNAYNFLLPSLFLDKLIQQVASFLSFDSAFLYKNNLKSLIRESGSTFYFVKSFIKPSTYRKIFNRNIDWNNVSIKHELSLKYWEYYFGNDEGTIQDEQFKELKKMVETILNNGGSAILLQMPIPEFNKEQSKFYYYYVNHFIDKIVSLQDMDENILYVDMLDLDDNDDFFDSFHAKPRVTKKWSKRLATEISSFLNEKN